MNSFTPAVLALTRREVVRFLRQRNRVVGALATPLVFWFLIGSGVGRSFSGAGGSASYLQYFFPGTLLLIILFTAIFSTISIIEDRREGFLQGVLVSPIPRSAFVLAKLLGGTLLSLLQCVLLYGLAAAMGLPATPGGFLLFLAAVVLLGLGLTALGYLIAWPLDSTQGFHALMNLVLMPLWFLSGALFPPAARRAGCAPSWRSTPSPTAWNCSAPPSTPMRPPPSPCRRPWPSPPSSPWRWAGPAPP